MPDTPPETTDDITPRNFSPENALDGVKKFGMSFLEGCTEEDVDMFAGI
jgi:hypothetical protein